MVYRPEITGHCIVEQDQLERNVAHALSLDLPLIEGIAHANHGPLAVVGGGNSSADQIEILREWPGWIWAINGTCRWLESHGIESILFSVDPDPCLAELCQGVKRAMLASHCDPSAFEALKGAEVMIFHGAQWNAQVKKPLIGGTTSATRVMLPAMMMGHQEVHYFGCEGSFRESTHTFKNENDYPRQVIVRAARRDYRSTLQFLVQSENLAMLIRKEPRVFKDRSGGLLGAMIADPDGWEIIANSEELCKEMDPTAITEDNRYKAA